MEQSGLDLPLLPLCRESMETVLMENVSTNLTDIAVALFGYSNRLYPKILAVLLVSDAGASERVLRMPALPSRSRNIAQLQSQMSTMMQSGHNIRIP
jgi:hypothetical protein